MPVSDVMRSVGGGIGNILGGGFGGTSKDGVLASSDNIPNSEVSKFSNWRSLPAHVTEADAHQASRDAAKAKAHLKAFGDYSRHMRTMMNCAVQGEGIRAGNVMAYHRANVRLTQIHNQVKDSSAYMGYELGQSNAAQQGTQDVLSQQAQSLIAF